jgi:hypothetical protein
MNNPRFIQCSSETEYQAMLVFQRYFQRALQGGLIEPRSEWMIGVRKPRDGKLHGVVQTDSVPIDPAVL